ncbi:ESPR-type extended signal peptide-containing protein, partial [Veillonella denticariosi]|uniref:ESPR-type extended signal peptide-containing protein n=1 Tax=Veillonella denticariosi TaxID=419208 RepID=UPI0024927D1F
MNRIYNVIWSKTKKCYVVVSEIVKTGGGKVKSVQSGTTWARMSAIMAVAALLMGGNITTVHADTYSAMTINGVNAGYATAKVDYSEGSYLYNYQNPGNNKPLDGSNLLNGVDRGNYTENSFAGIAIGTNTKIQETGHPTYYSGLAIGNYAQATGGISFALGHYAQATSPSAMALGTATKASGFNSLAMMRQSAAEGDFSAALGTVAWAKGNGSFAMGYSATAKADQSIAIGAAETKKLPGQQHGTPSAQYNADGNTVTEGVRSLAFGTKARTSTAASDSMAFGSSSSTGGANAVAMGYSANASAENAFAIGNTAQSSAQNAVAMGKSANASGANSFAMGNQAKTTGADAIAMGSTAEATKSNSIALGGNAKSLGADALALGGAANASKDGAIAIGKEAKANNTNTTAIGLGATVTGLGSMAIGTNAVAESKNSLALGSGTEIRGALHDGYSAFTNEINHAEAGVVAVGNVGMERRIINVAGGENDTDAANVKQLRFVNSNLAQSLAGPTYTGYEANGSTYKAPDFNIKNSTYHTVKEAVEAAQTNFFSAKGTSADANYDNTGATGNNATAAGVRTSAAGNFATAVGADATAANANSTAIGYKAKSSVDDGVALGANSVASVGAGKAGYNVKTADSRTNGYSGLTGAALTSTMGAVSVGDGGTKTRQITNVAAGTADTDAVNVAQLRNVNLKVAGNSGNNDVLLDNQTLTVKGDGSYVTTSVN